MGCMSSSLSSASLIMQGREDLQLDERLMQMLHSANAGLRADEASAYRGLHARTFAVIPLGPTMGLIEWVEHSAPLFGIYQAWQKRSTLTSGGSPAVRAGYCILFLFVYM